MAATYSIKTENGDDQCPIPPWIGVPVVPKLKLCIPHKVHFAAAKKHAKQPLRSKILTADKSRSA